MKHKASSMDPRRMRSATHKASIRVEETIRLANELAADTRKQERLAKQYCKACHYYTWIGGAAITEKPCMSCGTVEAYSSTICDDLCIKCAKEGSLCKRCGGDLEMRRDREDWPTPITSPSE